MSMTFDDLKRIAKEQKVSVKKLIVLAPQNDPFYTGTDGDLIKAQWFAEIWNRFGYTSGAHLRRVHYQIVSQHGATDVNGKPYENTERCWLEMQTASKAARYLGMVPVDGFIDARNPPAKVFHGEEYVKGEPWLSLTNDEWELPAIAPEVDYSLEFPEPELYGYGYHQEDQPYMIEIWCEKSTMNDVLVPICKRYRANFVTGLGFLSITAVQNLLDRARQSGKPTRVLYISDFDPAGSFMPQQIARQIEFWLQQKNLDLDIALMPLALTKEQIIEYELPRIPIKDSDRRAANFEDKHGEGAVELDALEALYPGSLADIVTSAIREFIDPDFEEVLSDAEEEAEKWLEASWQEETENERQRFTEIAEEIATISEGYRARLVAMSAELDHEIEPYRQELKQLRQAITEAANQLEEVLPERPEPETDPDDGDWLFRSDRDYITQLCRYKAQ